MKDITQKELQRFVQLTKGASYNPELKEEYRKLGRKILKWIAEQMHLTRDQYEIRWNPGGIAVSGDHTLHTDHVYLALHDNCGFGWFIFRTCKGRKDYTGGTNQIVTWDDLLEPSGLQKLVERLNTIQYVQMCR